MERASDETLSPAEIVVRFDRELISVCELVFSVERSILPVELIVSRTPFSLGCVRWEHLLWHVHHHAARRHTGHSDHWHGRIEHWTAAISLFQTRSIVKIVHCSSRWIELPSTLPRRFLSPEVLLRSDLITVSVRLSSVHNWGFARETTDR